MKKTIIFLILALICSGCTAQPLSGTIIPPTIALPSITDTPWQSSTPLAEQVVTLHPALTATNTLEPSPIIDAVAVLNKLKAMEALLHQQVLQAEWTRTVHEIVYFDNMNGKYWDTLIDEQWNTYVNGELLEAYHWTTTADGTLDQEAVWLDGQFINLTFGSRPQGAPKKVGPNYYFGMVQHYEGCIERADPIAQVETTYEEHPAWLFTCEITEIGSTFQQFIFLDQETGYPLAKGTNIVLPEGSLKLVSGAVRIQLDIGADPPLERFARMKQEALAIP